MIRVLVGTRTACQTARKEWTHRCLCSVLCRMRRRATRMTTDKSALHTSPAPGLPSVEIGRGVVSTLEHSQASRSCDLSAGVHTHPASAPVAHRAVRGRCSSHCQLVFILSAAVSAPVLLRGSPCSPRPPATAAKRVPPPAFLRLTCGCCCRRTRSAAGWPIPG